MKVIKRWRYWAVILRNTTSPPQTTSSAITLFESVMLITFLSARYTLPNCFTTPLDLWALTTRCCTFLIQVAASCTFWAAIQGIPFPTYPCLPPRKSTIISFAPHLFLSTRNTRVLRSITEFLWRVLESRTDSYP